MTWEMYDALVDACERVDATRRCACSSCVAPAARRSCPAPTSRSFGVPHAAPTASPTRSGSTPCSIASSGSRKPTIAQVEGVAAGGGCAIALVLRPADRDARLDVRRPGRPHARQLSVRRHLRAASRSDRAGAGEGTALHRPAGRCRSSAHAAGLVNRVVEAGPNCECVGHLATEIAANAPLTIRATKEMLRRRIAAHRRLPAGADHDLIELCYTSEDFRNAVAAFLEKRRPVWQGR